MKYKPTTIYSSSITQFKIVLLWNHHWNRYRVFSHLDTFLTRSALHFPYEKDTFNLCGIDPFLRDRHRGYPPLRNAFREPSILWSHSPCGFVTTDNDQRHVSETTPPSAPIVANPIYCYHGHHTAVWLSGLLCRSTHRRGWDCCGNYPRSLTHGSFVSRYVYHPLSQRITRQSSSHQSARVDLFYVCRRDGTRFW